MNNDAPLCRVCSQSAAWKCTHCRHVFYCSSQCQQQDWTSAHASECIRQSVPITLQIGGDNEDTTNVDNGQEYEDVMSPYLFCFDLDGTLLSIQSRGALLLNRTRRRFLTEQQWKTYQNTPPLFRDKTNKDPSRSLDEVWADLPAFRSVLEYANANNHRYAIVTNSNSATELPIGRRTLETQEFRSLYASEIDDWEIIGGKALVQVLLEDAKLLNTIWINQTNGTGAIIDGNRPPGKAIHVLMAMHATRILNTRRVFLFEDNQQNLNSLTGFLRDIDARKMILVRPPSNFNRDVWIKNVDDVFLRNNRVFKLE